jgi:hypothetical protein
MMGKKKKLQSEKATVIPDRGFTNPYTVIPSAVPSRACAAKASEGPGFVLHLESALRRLEPGPSAPLAALRSGRDDKAILVPVFQLDILVSC